MADYGGYSRRRQGRLPVAFYGTKPPKAGVSFYKLRLSFARNLPHPPDSGVQISDVADPILKPHTSYDFRQHDRTFFLISTAFAFSLNDLEGWEKTGDMPQLIVMDHRQTITHRRYAPRHPARPISCVADNDQSVGVMVEGLSKSRFWGLRPAMFVLEDDAQDGRGPCGFPSLALAFVISPYAKHHAVDSTFYNTTVGPTHH